MTFNQVWERDVLGDKREWSCGSRWLLCVLIWPCCLNPISPFPGRGDSILWAQRSKCQGLEWHGGSQGLHGWSGSSLDWGSVT